MSQNPLYTTLRYLFSLYDPKYGYTYSHCLENWCLPVQISNLHQGSFSFTPTTGLIISSMDLFCKVSKNIPQLELRFKVSDIETVSWCYHLSHEELLEILNFSDIMI